MCQVRWPDLEPLTRLAASCASSSGRPSPPTQKGHLAVSLALEVTAGFEPADNGVADRGLTTWLRHQKVGVDYGARDSQSYLRAFRSPSKNWSGLRGSNPPPRPWQGRALPNELNPRVVNLNYLIFPFG